MTITIIDYGSGNLHSVRKAFALAGQEVGRQVRITSDPLALKEASHIILPGVGAYGDCVAGLRAIDGMYGALEEAVLQKGVWFFGICVGMQMMLSRGLEHGTYDGLGWIKGEVMPIEAPGLKIPHMGWNQLDISQPSHTVFTGINTQSYVYFVHSYHALCADAKQVLATTDYGATLTAMIGCDNMIGTQFHPEKSQKVGLQLIKNFVEM